MERSKAQRDRAAAPFRKLTSTGRPRSSIAFSMRMRFSWLSQNLSSRSLKPFCNENVSHVLDGEEPRMTSIWRSCICTATYLVLLLGKILVSGVIVLGELQVSFETSCMKRELVGEILPKLLHDTTVLWVLLIGIRVAEHIVDAALSELGKSRLKSMSDGLISGLEIALTLVSGLNAGVCKMLCTAPAKTASAARCGGSLCDGGGS